MISDTPAGLRLLDPEIAPVLTAYPPFGLSAQTLAAVRERLHASKTSAPDGAQLLSGRPHRVRPSLSAHR
ncbi:hypothetical protein [Nocardia bovistercoris]|uniref:Uncharacterized protein n=1 Tax=Nocardia bovistercoris TaxID=2785916 RepID=A0A931IHD6_9NOCA|nr:hypothetical protein [Nocardia bovistercoris]MBH0779755.1 hypothetical protein [Nocardia bovistercoris]